MDTNNKDKAIRGKKLSQMELAYIAGLLDGEGCINIYRITTDYMKRIEKRKQPKWILSISIYNTHYETIKWLHDIYGGTLQIRHKYKKPIEILNGKWKQSYAWRLSANKANQFLKTIVKYLRIKKDQAELAIRFQDNLCRFHKEKKGIRNRSLLETDIEFRERCWFQMKSLNHREFYPQRLNEKTPE